MAGDEALYDGERGAGGISWADRSRMGLLRGVIDAADATGRRNAYMHTLHTQVLERELRRAAPLRYGLDFGCGTGRFLRTLRRYCEHVYAVDREPAMVQAARSYGHASADWIECCADDALPFADGFFDFVLCSSVLCVTTRRLFGRSLQEISRVMHDGSRLLLLEQVSRARGLPLRRYYDALYDAGLEPLDAYPIRPGGSPFTRMMAHREWIPSWSYPLFARLELLYSSAMIRVPKGEPYVEYALLAGRRDRSTAGARPA